MKVQANVKIGKVILNNMLQERVNRTNSANYLFYWYLGDSLDFIEGLDTSSVTSFNCTFYGCNNITKIPQIDTSNGKQFSQTFYGCSKLTDIPYLEMSNAITTTQMFHGCESLTTIPLFNTSKVDNATYMFRNCTSLVTVPALDFSRVSNMQNIFYGCPQLKSILAYGMKVSFDISASTQFETSDLVVILNNLATVTTPQTLTMGATNLAKLSEEQKAIATSKGWTLA